MIALIDMDLVCYRCAASAENDPFEIAVFRMNDLVNNILSKVNAESYVANLSSKTNFRKGIYPEYKANRKQPKPLHLKGLIQEAKNTWNAEEAPEGLEADDMLGILQDKVGWWSPHNGEEKQYKTTICTLDKDLLQIPGNHFSWEISGAGWTRPDIWVQQTELEGYRLFYEQVIKGDSTDNIKGIPKKGPKFASKVLANCKSEKEMFDIVRDLYSNDEEFKMNAGCVWILRDFHDTFEERFKTLANI